MNRWPTKPLLDLAILTRGTEPGSSSYIDSTNGTRFLRVGDITGKTDNPVYTNATKLVIVTEKDILLALDGTPGYVSTGHSGAISSGIRKVEILDKRSLIMGWVRYALNSPEVQATIKQHTRGITILHASSALPHINISVPPLAEQERIVNLLDEADELRKLSTKADSYAATLISALFHKMFGDPESNPKKWPARRAGDLMVACDYGTSQKSNDQGRGIVVLRMGNVTSEGELDLSDIKAVELSDEELAKQRLQPGDVLFNRTNSRELVGKTGLWDGRIEAVAASYFIRVRFNSDVEHSQHFTTFMNLPTMKHRLAKIARGAVGQANINSKELRSIELPVPPLLLQKEFAARVREIRTMQAEQAASRKRLDDLFQSMLHRAFNGEL